MKESYKTSLSGLRRQMRQSARRARQADARKRQPAATPDRLLFRQAMQTVTPLTRQNRISPQPQLALPETVFHARRQHAQTSVQKSHSAHTDFPVRAHAATDPFLHSSSQDQYLLPGCGTDLLRGLRKGRWPAAASLDLHGCSTDQALARLNRFLISSRQEGLRCVHIIHGKGFGSYQGKSVLKLATRRYLSQHPDVQAWVQCHERNGGSGAVLVLLRRQSRAGSL